MIKWLFKKLGATNKDEFWKLFFQFVKFGLVGVSNTLVSLACYYIICFINPDLYLLGSVVGTILSIANAFFWNDKFVFSGNDNSVKAKLHRLLKTYVSYGGTSLLSTILLWIEVDIFSISKIIAPIVNLVITIPLNFIINKLWTFRKSSSDDEFLTYDSKKRQQKRRIVMFLFFVFFIVNVIIVLISGIEMSLPIFKNETYFNVNLLYNNLHLSADKKDTFMDFFNSIRYGREPYTKGVIYPPLINLIYGVIGKVISPNIAEISIREIRKSVVGLTVYSLTFLTQVFSLFYAIWITEGISRKEKILIWVGLMFTLPSVYCFERGNNLILCAALVLIFVNKYNSSCKRDYLIAYIALAVATGIKIYPVLFGLLLIRDRRWKDAVKAIIVGVVVFFLPFLFFSKENRSISLLLSNILNCNTQFQNVGMGFRLDLSTFMEVVSSFIGGDLSSVTGILRIFICVANACLVFFDRDMEKWKAIALISLIVILVPGFSWTYVMVYMFVPIVFFIKKGEYSNLDFFYLVILIMSVSFVPISNQFGAFSSINGNAKYKLGWTCLVENVSLIVLESSVVIERFCIFIKNISLKKIERI